VRDHVRETALACVKEGGAILLDYRRKLGSLEVQAKGRLDYVTEADLAVQEALVRLIRWRHPGHDILAEEGSAGDRRHAMRWILDPLDGTTNFIHGFPAFAVSLALEHEESLELGAIYDPSRDELFFAEKGQGATLNGEPFRVSERDRPDEALVATAFPWRRKSLLDRYLEVFTRIFRQVNDVRRTGSAALDLAYVACGRCEGFWEVGLKPWDIAAGHVLVREAGGTISDFSGGDDHLWVGDVVAGTPGVHRFLLGVIREVFGGNVSSPANPAR
jgi:myo-inositol-1(or 4)-monophosphatase